MTAPDHHDKSTVPKPSSPTHRQLLVRAHRQWLVQAHHTASRDYDKALMTLAGGGLGVSIVFIRDVEPHVHIKWLLVTGWVLLVVSLFAILIAFLTSQEALRLRVDDLDHPPAKPRSDRYGGATGILNRVSGGCFVLGAVCVVIFAGYNL